MCSGAGVSQYQATRGPQEAADGEINESEDRSKANTIRAPVQPLAEAGQLAEQRHRKLEGKIALWFDPKSNQFIPKPNPDAMRWPNTKKDIIRSGMMLMHYREALSND